MRLQRLEISAGGRMRVLDLFSGLFSEVPATSMQCVHTMRDRLALFHAQGQPIRPCDVLLAAPPCREFSGGFNSPKSIASREGLLDEYEPDMSLIEATLDIIRIVKPRYWVIENVVGSIRYFKQLGLEPRQIFGAHVFYGNFPMFDCGPLPTKASKDVHSSNPLRANLKAIIPLPLSIALRTLIVTGKQSNIGKFP